MYLMVLQRNLSYAAKYLACEALCLVNVVLQLLFMDRFLGGEFLSYGARVLQQEPHERADAMALVFPRVAKCQFQRYGPSGGMVTVNTLCLLPLNAVNEKTYAVLWFWLVALAALLSALLVYRLLLCWALPLRLAAFRLWHRAVPPACAHTLAARASLAHWWLLHALAANVDELVFRDVVRELVDKLWPAPRRGLTPRTALTATAAAETLPASAPEEVVELDCLAAA